MLKRMCVSGFLALCIACTGGVGTSCAASVSDVLSHGADTLSSLSDVLRGADDARDLYYRNRSGSDAARYEREWRDREYALEEARIRRMAKEANVSPSRIADMREDGRSWQDIAKRYSVDPKVIYYGHRAPDGYDRDHDHGLQERIYKDHPGKAKGHYKGTADGPPGQYKKDKKDKKNKGKKNKDRDDD